jgi:hypothetical protein
MEPEPRLTDTFAIWWTTATMIYATCCRSTTSKSAREFIRTESASRDDYILHPPTGEKLTAAAVQTLEQLGARQGTEFNVQIMISDGLNANAITDPGHVDAYLPALRQALQQAGLKVAPETIVCTSGRVRAGYRAGEVLFGARGNKSEKCALLPDRGAPARAPFFSARSAPVASGQRRASSITTQPRWWPISPTRH